MQIRILVIAATAGLVLLSSPASAQTFCPEGRTASGACVDPALASAMRQRTRVFSQPRLSYSGPAIAPSLDREYDVLRDAYSQGLRNEIYGPCTAQFCP